MKLSVGLRYDISKLKNINAESSVSPKAGINYKLSKQTVFRGSFGTGFRAPTLAEAFTSTTTSGLTVRPNPAIKSERSISFECGINHSFGENINVDLALFHNEYFDMIEPVLDSRDASVFFDNITRARVQGFELNAATGFLNNDIVIKVGYNYLWPRDIEKNVDLKYRSRHQAVASVEWKYKLLSFGAEFRYLSRISEIDNELVDFRIVVDGDKRVDIKVIDLKVSANFFTQGIPIRTFLIANNILNYTYVEMIGNISPIRNYSFSTEILF